MSGRDPVSGMEHSRFVAIAAIPGDAQLASRLTEMFQKAGIVAIVEGSIAYGVSVAPAKRVEATELLRKDAETHNYWVEFIHE